jgi:hypothetical protein
MIGLVLANRPVPTSPLPLKCAIVTPLSPVSIVFFSLFLFFSLLSKDEVRSSGVQP